MSHPDAILVKLTPGARAPADAKFYISKPTGNVFFNREELDRFLVEKCLSLRFDTAEIAAEPPAGAFPVVARCTLNGALIGPPNHHEYRDSLERVRLESAPHLSADQFAKHIEMVREPEVIEAWRQAQAKQVRYGVKGSGTHDLTRRQAEDLFREKHLAELAVESPRHIGPLPPLLEGSDFQLSELVRQMHQREMENPFSILLALRPAFKQMGLHLFRARDTQFVIGVVPHPLPPGTALVPELRALLDFVEANPDIRQEAVVSQFAPGVALDSPEAGSVKKNIRLLVDKGHLILFHDGTLHAPRAVEPVHGHEEPDAPAEAPEEPAPAAEAPEAMAALAETPAEAAPVEAAAEMQTPAAEPAAGEAPPAE